MPSKERIAKKAVYHKTIKGFAPVRESTGLLDSFQDICHTRKAAEVMAGDIAGYTRRSYTVVPVEVRYMFINKLALRKAIAKSMKSPRRARKANSH